MIKKFVSLICGALLLMNLCVSACAEKNVRVRRENPKSLVVLGDSIASGFGLEGYVSGDNYSAENYGKMLKNKYAIDDESYFNFAVDGLTSGELLEKIESGEYDSALSSELVVISIGGNDLLGVLLGNESVIFKETEIESFLKGEISLIQAVAGADLAAVSASISSQADEKVNEFKSNMPKIISYIKAKNPDAQIVLQNLYNPMNTGVELIDTLYRNTIGKLNTAIAETEGCVMSDVYTSFRNSGESLIQQDYTHPNEKGHALIFEAVSTAVSENCEFYDTVKKTSAESDGSAEHIGAVVAAAVAVAALGVTVFFTVKRRKNAE